MRAATTSYEYITGLKRMHKLMLISNVVFCIVFAFIGDKTGMLPENYGNLHQIAMIALAVCCVAGIIGGNWLFKQKVDAILQASNTKLPAKLEAYRTACILRWAITELPLLFSNILLFLTGNYYYIIFIFILFIFFVLYTPSKEQVINHLQLSGEEQDILQEEYAEIG